MSVCTLFLYHDPNFGWHVEIDGLIYSQRQSFKKQYPKTQDKNGELTLLITPNEEPEFNVHRSKPPLHVVIPYLKQIVQQADYKIVATDSTSDENGYRKTTLWTLQN